MLIALATKRTLLELAEIVTEEPCNSDCCSSRLSVGPLVGTGKTMEQVALPGKLHSVFLLSVPAAGLSHVISGELIYLQPDMVEFLSWQP